jgi:hypothetical protein
LTHQIHFGQVKLVPIVTENELKRTLRVSVEHPTIERSECSVKTKEQIDELIEDVKELGSRIQSIDNLIQAIEDSEIKEKYHKDLLALIGNYNRLLSLLEREIVEYNKYERDNGLPINLRYRSILKTLRSR